MATEEQTFVERDHISEMFARMEDLQAAASVDAVFGEPIKTGDKIVIPVARVSFGFGLGFGEGIDRDAEKADLGGGGGGGGGVSAQPIALVEITPERTHVEPVVNEQQVVMGGILLTAWTVFWIAWAVRKILGH